MELILLLLFSVAGLDSPEFDIREETTQRLRILGPVAWPALMLASESEDAEVRYRLWSLMLDFRRERRTIVATEILFNPWPLTSMEAQALYHNQLLWRSLWAVTKGKMDGSMVDYILVWLNADDSNWDWNGDREDWQRLQTAVNQAKKLYGGGIPWMLSD